MAGRTGVWARRIALVSTAALSLALAAGSVSGAVVTHGAATRDALNPRTGASAGSSREQQTFRPPAIKHVWVIELENEGIGETFGNPSDAYLGMTLPSMGALLENYYSIGHNSLDNYIAEISGQAPDTDTQDDCPVWVPFAKTAKVTGKYGQLKGDGCVFPARVQTLGNQLSAHHLSWAAYLQDMGNSAKRDHTTKTKNGPACGHPKVGSADDTEAATAKDQYATRHEGFMYFESVIGSKSYCDRHILSFRPLTKDLAKASTTPRFSWITPNLCNDGHDSPCANGQPGGLTSITSFLESWLPKIMDSPAYKSGMIVITFDEASTSDSSACCGERTGKSASHPNVAKPGKTGPGGGLVGAVILSPFVKPGTVSTVKYNHYSLLRSVEDIFGLSHLGDARMPQVKSFGPDVYTNP
jgi:phosphatidylinositol-3-phosphatase